MYSHSYDMVIVEKQLFRGLIAPPPAEASEIVHQDALAYSEFSQGVG